MERKDSTTSHARGELLGCHRKCVRATPNHRSTINSERLLNVFMCQISFNNNFETITFNTFPVTGFAVRIRYVGRRVIFPIVLALPGKTVVARSYRFVGCSYVLLTFFNILKKSVTAGDAFIRFISDMPFVEFNFQRCAYCVYAIIYRTYRNVSLRAESHVCLSFNLWRPVNFRVMTIKKIYIIT